MSAISPPKDYRRCALCGTHRPEKRMRSVQQAQQDPAGPGFDIPTHVWICADDVDQEGYRFSRFCQRVRGITPEDEP
jgi:hypothetical protein